MQNIFYMSYQMGKVGSSSIVSSIKKNNRRCIHIHRLYFSNNENQQLGFFNIFSKLKIRFEIFLNQHILRKKIKIITAYRDPLKRNISSFFQNLNKYYPRKKLNNIDVDSLILKFNQANFIHDTPINWFDLELKRRFKIDILSHDFDKESGYTIIRKGNVEVFVHTLEKLNSLEKELSDFLEIKDFSLHNANVGSKKWYNNLYKEFMDKYIPPADLFSKLYDSSIIKYFYKDEFIQKLKNNYSRKILK